LLKKQVKFTDDLKSCVADATEANFDGKLTTADEQDEVKVSTPETCEGLCEVCFSSLAAFG